MAEDETSEVQHVVLLVKALKDAQDSENTLNEIREIPNFVKGYMPRVIRLGPLYGKSDYEQLRKATYLCNFFAKRSKVSIELLVNGTMQLEARLRSFYEVNLEEIRRDLIEFSSALGLGSYNYLKRIRTSDLFLETTIADGIFLIELFLRLYIKDWEETDRISRREWTDMMLDFLLVDNQLPFFFLEHLFQQSRLNEVNERYQQLSMLKLAKNFLTEFELLHKDTIEKAGNLGEAEHLLEMFLICMQPLETRKPTKYVNLVSPTIQELNRAGVKFRPASTKRLFDIKFDLKTGILEIPTLKLDETTPIIFYNLITFEGKYGRRHYMNDYMALMDFLIDRPEDIQLLVRKGIIKNFLPEDIQSLVEKGIMENHRKDVEEAAADFINRLGKVTNVRGDFYYSSLIEDLNEYCQTRWSKLHANVVFSWKSSITQEYRNNPWVSI